MTAVALAFADASIVALAIPDLYVEFGSTIPAVSWVLTAYALAVAATGLLYLSVLRRISGTTLTVAGAAIFAASSLAAGFAPSLAALIVARVAQGVGGAALAAGSLGVLAALVGDRSRAARWWAAAGVAGAALGPVLGGAVTQLLDWRAVFIVQAPIALLAAVAAMPVGGRVPTVPHAEARRRPGALVADAALALTFGALVGVLFLAVLLLVVVWGLPPIVGALVVSALPVGTLVTPRLATHVSERGAVVAGSAALGGGLLTLAHLPSIEPAWVAAGLALCGVGFGTLVHALNRHVLPAGSGVRAATVTSTARHLGLVLGLAIIAPVLASQVTTAAEEAPLAATRSMLDAPIDAPTKVRIALDIRNVLDDASDGEVPDLEDVFARHGAASDPQVAQLGDDVERGVQEVLTRSFSDSFTLAAVLALLAGIVGFGAIELASRQGTPGVHAPRRRLATIVVGSTVAASVLVPMGAVSVRADGFGESGVADPCTAPPDPFPGDGLDAAAQRLVLSGLNGAACELGISREALVLSFEPRSGVDVDWDRDTVAQALKDGVGRAVRDADERGTLPGWVATPLRWTIEQAPLSWFLDQLGVR